MKTKRNAVSSYYPLPKLHFFTFNCALTILIPAFFKAVLFSKTAMYFTNSSLEEQHTESNYCLWYIWKLKHILQACGFVLHILMQREKHCFEARKRVIFSY